MEVWRHHADDPERNAVHHYELSNGAPVATESLHPECVAQQDDVTGAWPAGARIEQSTGRRRDAEHGDHVGRCDYSVDAHGVVVIVERDAPRTIHPDVREASRALAQSEHLPNRPDDRRIDDHERLWLAIRERLEEQRIHE
jgi:hypothetical protein